MKEIPDYTVIEKRGLPEVKDIIKIVASYFNIMPSDIINLRSRQRGNFPRKIALYLSTHLSDQTYKTIATEFVGINSTGVSSASGRIRKDIKDDLELLKAINVNGCQKAPKYGESNPNYYSV